MRTFHYAALIVCFVLSTACTTPPPPYEGGEAAATRMAEKINAMLATNFNKASTPPKVKHAVAPEGNSSAANHGVMGTVLFQVEVAKDGRVKEVKVLESPNQYLSEDVIKSFLQWEFTPMLVNGEPKEFKLKLNIPFSLRR